MYKGVPLVSTSDHKPVIADVRIKVSTPPPEVYSMRNHGKMVRSRSARAASASGDGNGDGDADGDGSGSAFLTQNEFGNTDVDDGAVRLNSPIIDMSGGSVTISYVIDEQGRVRIPVVVAADAPALADPAITVARSWRYVPVTYHGRPVLVEDRRTLRFRSRSQ